MPSEAAASRRVQVPIQVCGHFTSSQASAASASAGPEPGGERELEEDTGPSALPGPRRTVRPPRPGPCRRPGRRRARRAPPGSARRRTGIPACRLANAFEHRSFAFPRPVPSRTIAARPCREGRSEERPDRIRVEPDQVDARQRRAPARASGWRGGAGRRRSDDLSAVDVADRAVARGGERAEGGRVRPSAPRGRRGSRRRSRSRPRARARSASSPTRIASRRFRGPSVSFSEAPRCAPVSTTGGASSGRAAGRPARRSPPSCRCRA